MKNIDLNIPGNKRTAPLTFFLSSPFKWKNVYCLKILIFDQILLKRECGGDECRVCHKEGRKIKVTVTWFCRHLFNDTVSVKFRVCFAMSKYENDIFLVR